MSDSTHSLAVIDYYTDMLCVWAWIAQPRLEELQRQWGKQIEVRHRYVDIFGDGQDISQLALLLDLAEEQPDGRTGYGKP